MTEVLLDDQLVADSIRATGLLEKDKAVETMLRLQLQLQGQKDAIFGAAFNGKATWNNLA